MLNKKEILVIARAAYDSFSRLHKIDVRIRLISSKAFWKLAKKSSLVRDKIKKNIPIAIGALVVHSSIDTVYVSKDVINSITDDPKFIKAIFLHEFYHIYFKSQMKDNKFKSSLESEDRAKSAMKKDFPILSKYLV
jgi:hypothetical protein